MNEVIYSVRGMRDIFPPESEVRYEISKAIKQLLTQFGYSCIELPLLEKTALFQRTIGDDTDIVTKEMYTFLDRNNESLTLRPETTAGMVRAMIENGDLQRVQRLYTEGAMFRYERPQKGRYRQFTQISAEVFGIASAALDVELMQIGHALFSALNIRDTVTLEINTLGSTLERAKFQADLVDYLTHHQEELDDDSQRRLMSNPLRILDSKNAKVQQCLEHAPVLYDYLGEESRAHFSMVTELLDALAIGYQINPRLVRGLDYYCHSVFEWTTNKLGAQGTICAGGRYDGLVEQLGGKPTPAAGFAFGIDRIALLVAQITPPVLNGPDVYVLAMSKEEQIMAMQWAMVLRTHFPKLRVVLHNEFQPLKRQLKKVDKIGARFSLIFGPEECQKNQATIKNMANGEQQRVSQDSLIKLIEQEKGLLC